MMNPWMLVMALVLPLVLATPKQQRPPFDVHSPPFPHEHLRPHRSTPSMTFNVFDFGARGDGVADDTAAFQAALDATNRQSGGIVLAPPGHFLFKGTVVVPRSTTLQGSFSSVPSHGVGASPVPLDGSVLMPIGGRGNESYTPFITLREDSVLKGFVIYYPEQLNDTVPTPYPWTVDLTGNNPAVLDVECLNCWNAIRAVSAARHYIARVQGQPINIGIFVDQTYDIGRIEDVHFNPWFSYNPKFLAWQLLHGQAFVFARTDWEYVFNTFAFGYAVGYRFIESADGACNGNFLGIGADMIVNASVMVDMADPWGLLITNAELTSFCGSGWPCEERSSAQVVVSSSNSGAVRFVNSAFWGPSINIARLNGTGTVGFSDCTFNSWDTKGQGQAAIVANTSSLVVSGCDFQQVGRQVELSPNVVRAVITGNVMAGPLNITNLGAKNAQIGLNADSPSEPSEPPSVAGRTRPRRHRFAFPRAFVEKAWHFF